MSLVLENGGSVSLATSWEMSDQQCGEVIEGLWLVVSMHHLMKVMLHLGIPGRVIMGVSHPGGPCARAGVLQGGGDVPQAGPAVGPHPLAQQHGVDTRARRCQSRRCFLVRRENGMASFFSSGKQQGTLDGANRKKGTGCWQVCGAKPWTLSCPSQRKSKMTIRPWRMFWR